MPNPNERNLNELHEKIRDTAVCFVSDQGAALGEKVGAALGDLQGQIDLLTGNRTDEVNAAIASVNNLVNLLDGDAETPGLQNLNKLLGLLTEYQGVTERLAAIDTKLGEQAATLATLQGQFSTFITGQNSVDVVGQAGCDCTKIEQDLSAALTTIGEMKGVDDAQAIQIAGLLSQVGSLRTEVVAFNAALATNAAAVAQAQAKADQAVRDTATLRDAVENNRVAAVNGDATNGLRLDALDALIGAVNVEAICTPAKAAFRFTFDESFGAAFARARGRGPAAA